jgi:hypothetical protein
MKHSADTRRYYLACLAARAAAFLFLVVYAAAAPERFSADLAAPLLSPTPLALVWLLLMGSMVFRLFPSRWESLGCQKAFAHRFQPTGRVPKAEELRQADRGALRVLLVWAAANAVFFLAHWLGRLDDRAMVCLAGFYGVCDIICILFFCPFQAWIMRNRCCTTCRIYNWDYLMLCTPLFAIQKPLTQSVCILAILIFLRWEVTYLFRRERFFESSNSALQCRRCQEHLCRYKRALSACGKEKS